MASVPSVRTGLASSEAIPVIRACARNRDWVTFNISRAVEMCTILQLSRLSKCVSVTLLKFTGKFWPPVSCYSLHIFSGHLQKSTQKTHQSDNIWRRDSKARCEHNYRNEIKYSDEQFAVLGRMANWHAKKVHFLPSKKRKSFFYSLVSELLSSFAMQTSVRVESLGFQKPN